MFFETSDLDSTEKQENRTQCRKLGYGKKVNTNDV